MIPIVEQSVVERYLEPHRHYHTLEHIYSGLSVINMLCEAEDVRDPVEVEIVMTAFWYHDAIYIPGAKDNEEKSAQLAQDDGYTWEVSDLVMSTVYPNYFEYDNATAWFRKLAGIIQDADLCGLGAYPPVFDHHTQQVRAEFNLISDEDFDIGRKGFWTRMLEERAPLFKTKLGRVLWEGRAKENIQRELNGTLWSPKS